MRHTGRNENTLDVNGAGNLYPIISFNAKNKKGSKGRNNTIPQSSVYVHTKLLPGMKGL